MCVGVTVCVLCVSVCLCCCCCCCKFVGMCVFCNLVRVTFRILLFLQSKNKKGEEKDPGQELSKSGKKEIERKLRVLDVDNEANANFEEEEEEEEEEESYKDEAGKGIASEKGLFTWLKVKISWSMHNCII